MSRRRLLGPVLGVAMALASTLVVSACGLSGEGVQVGSTNFSESQILANLFAESMAYSGIPSQVKELTTTEVVEPALERNQLQVMPGYLATFTEYLNAKKNGPSAPPVSSNNVASTLAAGQPLANAAGLTILNPAAAQDQNAFAVTPAYAAANNLTTLSQLGVFSQTNPVILGAGPDCPTRPFCEPGLESTYGIKFSNFVSLDTGGPLTVQALLQGSINLGLVFSSSGFISAYDLQVLADDKHLQAADNVIPVVNTSAMTPTMAAALNAVTAQLTTEDLQNMNAQVDLERKDPVDVARAWLASHGIKPSS